MKILGIINKDSAVAYHRIGVPLVMMANANPDTHVHVTNNINDETFKEGYDVVFYSRSLSEFAYNKITEMRAKYGFRIFLDIDDYWVLDEWHPLRKEYIDAEYHKIQTKHIFSADAVMVTNERLYNAVKPYNEQCYVIPNAIPQIEQYITTTTEPDERVRLFWQGSATHEADLELIRYAIENIANTERHKIKMVIAGWHKDEPVWQRMAKAFTVNGRLKHELIGAMTYQSYYQAYKLADVCLVPLVNSRFNSMKSNLKVLEAANLALPVIAHDVHPYKDLPITYARGTQEWVKAMKHYINNEQARIEDGQRLKEFCHIHFNHAFFCELRKQLFEYHLV